MNFNKLYEMGLFEVVNGTNSEGCNVKMTRVPGGWIFSTGSFGPRPQNDCTCFVPLPNKETLKVKGVDAIEV